jgi:hypothetical protein
VRFVQEQRMDSVCGVFRLPMTVRLQAGDSSEDRIVWVNRRDTTVRWTLPDRPSLVMIDPDGMICGRVMHELTTDELLDQFRSTGSVSRRIDAGVRLVERLADPRVRADFFSTLDREPFFGVRLKVVSALARLKPDSISFRDELQQGLVRRMRDPKANVRSTALNGLNAFRDAALRPVFEAALRDSSYYVEAAAMNCLLTIDSTTTAGLVLRKLESRSYRDIVALAALDWVPRYRIAEALPIVRRLARPGCDRELRMKSINTLFEMGDQLDSLQSIVLALTREPSRDFRMFGASLIRTVYPLDADRRLRGLVDNEQDSRVRRHIRALLSSGKNTDH